MREGEGGKSSNHHHYNYIIYNTKHVIISNREEKRV